MAIHSLLRIELNREALHNEVISFVLRKRNDHSQSATYVMTWINGFPRRSSYTIPVVDTDEDFETGELSENSYVNWLNNDYPNMPAVAVYADDAIEVLANDPSWEFVDVIADEPLATYTLFNSTGPTFEITDTAYGTAASPCTHGQVSITTSILAKTIKLNGQTVETDNTNNPVVLDVLRGITNTIELDDGNGTTIVFPQNASLHFPVLATDDISFIVTQSYLGATVVVNVEVDTIPNSLISLLFSYSLNGTNWQYLPSFTGQTPGDYTMYVRDQYGCQHQIEYTVDEIGTRDEYLFISKASAINFSEQLEWDDKLTFKTDENTLAHQKQVYLRQCDPMLFTHKDLVTVQFKSNFKEITAVVRDEENNETDITIEKRSENLDKFERMDAIYYKYKAGLTGIYFEAGKKYDEQRLVIGEYSLKGNLPDFAIRGQFIQIDGLGIYEITDVVFDSNINKKAIIIQRSHVGVAVTGIVQSNYDLLPFEVYEFSIDWSLFNSGLHDVVLRNKNTVGQEVTEVIHVSENILVQDSHPDSVHIRYFNDNNRDIFYRYGIENIIRVPCLSIVAGMEDETDITKGDLTSAVSESSVYELNEFLFTGLTDPVMRKLSIALSCEYVYINGVGYVKKEGVSIENIPNTNLYTLKAIMLKSNINYNTNRQGQVGSGIGEVAFDIPPFIDTGNGFIKI